MFFLNIVNKTDEKFLECRHPPSLFNLLYPNLTRPGKYVLKRRWRWWDSGRSGWEREDGGGVG